MEENLWQLGFLSARSGIGGYLHCDTSAAQTRTPLQKGVRQRILALSRYPVPVMERAEICQNRLAHPQKAFERACRVVARKGWEGAIKPAFLTIFR
jgi:hypothetical protein